MVDAPDVEEAQTPEQARSRSLTREANALRAEGRWQEALPLSFEAVRADPDNAAAVHNLGVLLTKSGRLAEGERASRHAVSLAPGSPVFVHALAHNLLAQGRYAEGWPLYEVRAQMPELNTGFPRDFPFPRWRGEPLAGKRLAIFPEQGLGDQIQFARFLPQLIRDAGAVTLLAMPQLERLFRHNFPGAEIVSASGKVEFPDPDYWTTLHDLPAVLGVEIDAIPCEPYLRPPEAWPALPGDFKIGLKAKGNPRHVNDALRSLPADCAEQLRTRLPGTIVSLEPEDSGAHDMADTAGIIDQLDLVVSVDTSVAHLAGALGKPCLLLIPGFSPDWRWMFDRTDSPWYPKHRLYRSGTDGDWGPAIDRLIEDVTAIRAQSPADRLVAEAIALRAAGQPLRALAATAEAVACDPDSVNAAYTHGIYLSQCGRLIDGEAILRRVHQAAPELPDPRYALGVNLLAQGRYREGWPLYEARTERTGLRDGFPRDFPYPRWKGEDLKGKRIVLFPEQGYGDQIQFVRFVSKLVQRGAEVILLTSPPLVRLFEHNFPAAKVLAASGSVDFPDPDYWATLADLPGMLQVQLEDLSSSPYLLPAEVRATPNAGFRIGLKLKGSPTHPNDHLRSLSHDLAEYLRSRLPGTLVSLEPEDTDARDFADTAAIIAGLDLVVSVDTSVAHLAGAMGKPCLLLVAGFDPDWRWMFARDDSPWYPGHRLFRGEVDGHWHGAIDRLIAEANERAVARKPTQAPRGSTELAQLMYRAADLRNATRYPEALDLMRRAVRLAPQNAGALNILGTMLSDIGRLDEAERYQRRALDLAPDYAGFRNGLALNLLAQGRYNEAWPLYEARADVPSITIGFPKGVPAPRWRGEPLAGKRIAIMPEQGFGDQIQFARFVPMLQERGAQIRLFTGPGLVDLFRSSLPGVEVEPAEGAVRLGEPDYYTTLVDMAQPLGVTIETLPSPPYLRTDRSWPRLPEGFKIGLRVGGSALHPNDAWRSLSSDDAAALRSRLPGTIIDLDPAQTGARDFADSAALLSQLDLIVSVDTSVAHLAGALDKPCLLLVPGLATDWRWMRDRDDSPWYPRHRLYRSALDGSWHSAIERLAEDAGRLANAARIDG